MTGILAKVHGTPYSQHAGARRASAGHDGIRYGYLFCTGCGNATVTLGDFADAAGCTPYMLKKWLNRQPVSQAIADRIRDQLAKIEE